MMGRWARPSSSNLPGKRGRDKAKAQAMAKGSDQSTALAATQKLVARI